MTIEDFLMPDFDMDMRVTVQLSPNWRTLESEIKQATKIAARHVEAGAKDRITTGQGGRYRHDHEHHQRPT